MRLVVLNVACPFAPVEPEAPGNVERLVSQLDAALVSAGHESIVMACEGSVTQGIHLATPPPRNLSDPAGRHRMHEQYRFVLGTFLEKWPIDLIHLHDADLLEYLPQPGIPVLATLHQPPHQYPPAIFSLDRPQTFLNCVCASQLAECPPCGYLLPEVASADNGLEILQQYLGIYTRLVRDARELAGELDFIRTIRPAGWPAKPALLKRDPEANAIQAFRA